jgi:hypothetical protein
VSVNPWFARRLAPAQLSGYPKLMLERLRAIQNIFTGFTGMKRPAHGGELASHSKHRREPGCSVLRTLLNVKSEGIAFLSGVR